MIQIVIFCTFIQAKTEKVTVEAKRIVQSIKSDPCLNQFSQTGLILISDIGFLLPFV